MVEWKSRNWLKVNESSRSTWGMQLSWGSRKALLGR
jgi:hypothetical protein